MSDHTLSMESSSGEFSCSSRQFHNLEDHKWATFINDDADEKKPKMSIKTRMKAIEDSEEKIRKVAYEKGITSWKTTKIPNVEGPTQPESKPKATSKHGKSTQKEIEVKGRDLLESLDKIVSNEKKTESKKRKEVPEHEEDNKAWREHQPLQYFWKPDPLFYLHLTQLGYSRVAVEKALYYTDNKSVDLAEKYIQEHPDITPLTKEEVLADAEAFLSDIKPQNIEDEDCDGNASIHENKKESNYQKMQLDNEEISSQENKPGNPKGEKEELSPQPKEKLKPNEDIESAEVIVEMLCVISPETALNATTLAIECSRASVKIMEELQKDKWRKLYEDWKNYGKSVNVYQTDCALHLYHLQEKLIHDGHLSYLAEVQNPHSPGLLLPVVLCILTNTNDVRKIYPRLSKVN